MCCDRLKAWRTSDPSGITALLWYLPVLNQSQAKPGSAVRAQGSVDKIQLHTYSSLSDLHGKATFTVLML